MVFKACRLIPRRFLPNRHQTRRPTLEDWDELDVAYDDDLTIFESERVQVNENGEAVGTTAVINDHEIILSQGKWPSMYGALAVLFLKFPGLSRFHLTIITAALSLQPNAPRWSLLKSLKSPEDQYRSSMEQRFLSHTDCC